MTDLERKLLDLYRQLTPPKQEIVILSALLSVAAQEDLANNREVQNEDPA